MSSIERVLYPGGHRDSPWIRRVSVPRVFGSALGFSGRLLRHQRFSFPYLATRKERKGKEREEREFLFLFLFIFIFILVNIDLI